jgi:hypothetical protein
MYFFVSESHVKVPSIYYQFTVLTPSCTDRQTALKLSKRETGKIGRIEAKFTA